MGARFLIETFLKFGIEIPYKFHIPAFINYKVYIRFYEIDDSGHFGKANFLSKEKFISRLPTS